MITVLVKFKISDDLNLKTLKEKFIETSEIYRCRGTSEKKLYCRY